MGWGRGLFIECLKPVKGLVPKKPQLRKFKVIHAC